MLKYGRDEDERAFDGIRRVSRPGRRVYVRHDRIPRVLSRPRHLDPEHLARADDATAKRAAQKVGGELLCEVW